MRLTRHARSQGRLSIILATSEDSPSVDQPWFSHSGLTGNLSIKISNDKHVFTAELSTEEIQRLLRFLKHLGIDDSNSRK